MPTDDESGMVGPSIVINGRLLTSAEAITLRLAIGNFRLWLAGIGVRDQLGNSLAAGYERYAANVERLMSRGDR